MILTFDFKFLKKIKKGEAYITFILYILIFSSFASKKSECFQGLKNNIWRKNCLYMEKKLFIYGEKTVYIWRIYITFSMYYGIVKA
ncbi:hypothetical protein C9432_16300 (plasmid) [Enterococcus faecalis]|nr:hypothetical protein C9432_16300 [Enterococcus faecalis]